MKMTFTLNGLEVTKRAIADFMENAEFKDDVTEEYKRGFYDFGNAAIEALNKMQQPVSSGEHETIKQPLTNYEKIKNMTPEELADFLGHICICTQIQYDHREFCDSMATCDGCIVKWLKQGAE